jgi:Family of unknown function (DUF5926)
VALASFVQAATARIRVRPPYADRAVTICTVLPLAWPAVVRPDGEVWVATQYAGGERSDSSRELAGILQAALSSPPGTPVPELPPPGGADSLRLQDLLDPASGPEVVVRADLGYWTNLAGGPNALPPEAADSFERMNAAVDPTARLASVDGAYWVRRGQRCNLRWVFSHDEDPMLDALARLHVAGRSALAEGCQLVGSLRTCGLLAPVWQLPEACVAAELEEPAAAFLRLVDEVVDDRSPLSAEQRRVRAAFAAKQVTVRSGG